ncbi:hypothetical protein [Tropicibacter sp. S64]|uniref:hypothetical protein n=1 Tax=Tropicibacter sp. S64 TaxID=3415122 RepID=UPI003C7C2A8B
MPVRFLRPLLICACACSATAPCAATYTEATTPSGNVAAYTLRLGTAQIAAPQYVLDFETGYAGGQEIDGTIGYGGLHIAGIGVGGGPAKIETGAGTIGGSDPIGSYALELADDGPFSGLTVLSLTFESALAYLSFYMIDSPVRLIDYGSGSQTMDGTGGSGNVAEFRGFVFSPSESVTKVSFPFDDFGADGWGIDSIAWGYVTAAVPLPATLPMLVAALFPGLALARRRRT